MINTERSQTNPNLLSSVVLGLSVGAISGWFESILVSLTGLNLSWAYIFYVYWFDVLAGGLISLLGYVIFTYLTDRVSILKRFNQDGVWMGTIVLTLMMAQLPVFLFSLSGNRLLQGLTAISVWLFTTLMLFCGFFYLLRSKGEKKYSRSIITPMIALFLFQAFYYGGFYLNKAFMAQTAIVTRMIVNTGIAIILLASFFIFQWLLEQFRRERFSFSKSIYKIAGVLVSVGFLVSLLLFFGVQSKFAYYSKPKGNSTAIENRKTSADNRPNVILISIDTLRGDRLGYYGYKRSITPNIDRLAKEGTVFKHAVSQSPWTLPSHASIMTSLYPSLHGANRISSKLGENFVTLAELLRDASYETAAFTGGNWMSPIFGLDQGFNLYDHYSEHNLHLRYVPNVSWLKLPFSKERICFSFAVPKIIHWLQANANRDKPFFLFLHTYEVHRYFFNDKKLKPYLHRMGFQYDEQFPDFTKGPQFIANNIIEWVLTTDEKKLEYFEALYDAEILFTDRLINDILNELDSLGMMNRTLIILTSDHGEGFNKDLRRVHHGGRLHNDQLLVPLIFRLPGVFKANKIVDVQVQIIDILPTILDVLNLRRPKEVKGASLMKYVGAAETGDEYPAFSEELGFKFNETNFREAIRDHYRIVSVISDGIKFIRSPVKDELYDLKSDPEEAKNLLQKKLSFINRFEMTLNQFVSDYKPIHTPREEPAKVKKGEYAEALEKLKSLGYLK